MGKQWQQCQTLFLGAPESLQMVTAAMKLRHLLPGRKVMTNLDSIFKTRDVTLPTKVRLVLDSILKSRDITLSTKVGYSQGYGFSSSHVWM